MSIFSKIRVGEAEGYVVFDSDSVTAILDICPINPGHLLVFPHEEVDYIFDLPQDRYHEVLDVVRRLAMPLKKVTSANRIGVTVEGFGVPHVHVHMVPVNAGNELNPERASPASKEELSAMAKRIRDSIAELPATI